MRISHEKFQQRFLSETIALQLIDKCEIYLKGFFKRNKAFGDALG